MTSVPSFSKSGPSAKVPATSTRRPESSETSPGRNRPSFPGLDRTSAITVSGRLQSSRDRRSASRSIVSFAGGYATTRMRRESPSSGLLQRDWRVST